MDAELHDKIKRLVAIEVRARLLVNAILREKHGCVRGSTSEDIDKAVTGLLELFELDKNFWKR